MHRIRTYLAKRAYNRAALAARTYRSAANRSWDIRIALALDNAECAAANRLARLIDPATILRAF